MLVDFDILPDDSRIWIYAAEQKLTNDKEDYILNQIYGHLQNWEAHKVPLTAGVSILENHFIVIALDESESAASGCAIDTLQNKIKEIESSLSISLLNRLNLFCRIDGIIKCMSTSQLIENVDKNTLFYDLTIEKKIELYDWLKPIKYGWCKKFLN